ncbi:MAG: M3 family metallopeptidase [Bacteroidales bacterium]|nr:M3 family metallopeptidase [Bacteroidales bacterium]
MAIAAMSVCACTEKNPLLKEWDTPFGIPPFEEIKTEDYVPAMKKAIEAHKAEIAAIVNCKDEPTFENTILAFDRSGELLAKVYGVFGNVESMAFNDAVAEASNEITPMMSAHSNEIQLNEALFARIRYVYDRKDNLGLDEAQLRLVDNIYKSFARNGAALDDAKKAELKEVNEAISNLQLKFSQNLIKETAAWKLEIKDRADLAGLSADFIAEAASRAEAAGLTDRWIVGLDNPSVMPFLASDANRELRIKVLDAYLNRCNNNNAEDNKDICAEIIRLKLRKAQLLGFDTFVDYRLEDRMAKNSENVYKLLDQVWKASLKAADKELKDIKTLAAKDGISTVQAADWRYYSSLAKAEQYSFDEEALKPYFRYENVREGIFYVANKLFGLSFERLENVPLPHPEAEAFECKDVDGTSLGVIFMDMFARPGEKSNGAWCSSYRDQKYDADGNKVNPLVTICGNFSRPVGDKPSLLNADETETFFHEFGHALASFMIDVKYQGIANFDHDFVELPSQLNEHWAFAPEVLKVYAKHYETGAVIPMELVNKYVESKNYGKGFAMTELLAAMYLDLGLYGMNEIPENFNVLSAESKILKEIGLISEIPPRYRTPYFLHIFSHGYDVGYYSYLWAQVLDNDAFKAFEETGDIFNQEMARKYRYEILRRGDEVDADVLYRNFRGHDATVDALLEYNGLK